MKVSKSKQNKDVKRNKIRDSPISRMTWFRLNLKWRNCSSKFSLVFQQTSHFQEVKTQQHITLKTTDTQATTHGHTSTDRPQTGIQILFLHIFIKSHAHAHACTHAHTTCKNKLHEKRAYDVKVKLFTRAVQFYFSVWSCWPTSSVGFFVSCHLTKKSSWRKVQVS